MKLKTVATAGKFVLALGVLGLLGAVGLEPQFRVVRVVGEAADGFDLGPGDAPLDGSIEAAEGGTVAGGSRTTRLSPQQRASLACARGRNGGETDIGVYGDRVRLASTMVQTGIGASFLGLSPVGMRAVVQKVNKAGGICGRLLELQLIDDKWSGPEGQKNIQNFIKEGYFALPVVPSSEGLTQAIRGRDIEEAGIPVVGSDGMLIDQYQSPWVWPVATATVSTMRIMAKYGYLNEARSFAIVYDERFKFGVEGSEAFRKYVTSLPGASLEAFVGVQPGQASYSTKIQEFNRACASGCDFVALLLEPGTAETWIAGGPARGTKFNSGAQTLFNERFAANCGTPCGGMLVWTGYNPPIGMVSAAGVSEYVNDVRTISPTADVTNQFLEGAYLGMSVFVEGLKQVGPELTRARLRQVLDSMSYASDLSSPLTWSSNRHANRTAQAFSIVATQGSFRGFRSEQTGFIVDPDFE